jgi:uncharacterized RDD family membrane protein YckC
VTAREDPDSLVGLQGTYAGFMTRLGSFLIDVVAIAGLFALAAQALDYVVTGLRGGSFTLSHARLASTIVFVGWAFVYCAYPLAVGGRTLGMAIVGLQAVRADGGAMGSWRAVLRVLVFPLSFLAFGVGLLLILLTRDRRALHDLIAGTAVVYAWDARAARLRFLARRPPG